jgi:hypothetical protein
MTHILKVGRHQRHSSNRAIALLALITAVAFTIPFMFNNPAGAVDGPAGEPTTTHGVQPTFVSGNPAECRFSDAPEGFRINAPSSGTFTDPDNPDFSITLTIPSENPPEPRLHEGPSFDFVASGGVVENILVKGGPNANDYDFGPGVASDTYLHSPVNPSNDKYFGLSHLDICYNPAVVKSGTKFHDHNANGVRDTGDEGLSGWAIKAYTDNDSSGDLSAGDTLAAETTTDGDGNYSLALTPGAYIVCEVLPADWEQSSPVNEVCENDAVDASLAPGGYAVNLTDNESGNDFGNFQNATKSGQKFEDANADGVKDEGEDGLSGWTIHLFGTDGMGNDVHEHATTDADGNYTLTVKPGSYTVCEELQTGWSQSFPSSGADCSGHTHDGAITPGAVGYDITLESGDEDTGNDFGNVQQATKSGIKFKDANNNGVFDGDDTGLEGWTINVYNDTDSSGTLNAGDTLEDSTTTDINGAYSFTLDPGDYLVCEVAQDHWSQTAPNNVVCNADPLGDGLADGGFAITLGSGDVDSDNDFGNTPLSDFDVRFFDLTGFTDATIECEDELGNPVGANTDNIDDGTADPETTVEAEGVTIGTYVCTITITDP